MKLRKLIACSPVLILLFIAYVSIAPSKVSADYDGGNLIGNSIFLDANSMSSSTIQTFLASKNSGLTNRSFTMTCSGQGSREWALYTSVGAPCGSDVPASHIIYYVGQVYGVSPKVILATLQKEQSLVTSTNPTVWNINQAMGYSCPTTGDCDSNSSFFWQLDNGVWALRYHYERANGNFSWWNPSSSWVCGTEKNFYRPNLYPQQNVNFYDGSGILYRTHFLDNAATSAMYCYTPHAYNNPEGLYGRMPYGTTGQYYSGSYNFVTAYEAWFGSTKSNEHMWRVIRIANDSKLYLQVANTKRWIPTGDLYSDWGLDQKPVTTLSENEFNSIPTIPELTRMGTTGQYNYVVERGRKHFLPSNYTALWGYQNTIAAPVTSLLSLLPEYEPMGRFIKSDATTYWLINGGTRHPISASDLYAWRYTPQDTVGLGSSYLTYIPTAAQASRFIQVSGTSYVVDGGELLRMPDSAVAGAWTTAGYQTMSSSAPSFLPTRSGTGFLVRSVSTPHWYMLNEGMKHYISNGDIASNWGIGNNPTIISDDLLQQLTTGITATNLVRDTTNQKVYVLDGTKHHVLNGTLLDTLTTTSANVMASSSQRLAKISDGANYSSPVVVRKNSPHVYLLDKGQRYHIYSGSLLDSLAGLGQTSLSATLVDTIPGSSQSLRPVVGDASGNYFLIDQTRKWPISAGMVAAWKSPDSPTFSASLLSLLPAGSQTISLPYVRQGAARYTVDNGTKSRIIPAAYANYPQSASGFLQTQDTLQNSSAETTFLLRSSSSQKVWFINQGTRMEVNFTQQVTLGYLSGNITIPTVSDALLDAIPTSSSSFSLLIRKPSSGGVKMMNFGTSLGFPDGTTLTAHIGSPGILLVDDWIYDRFLLTGNVTRVIKDDAGKLYLVQNGTRSWISSQAAYNPYRNIPITYLYGTTMSIFPEGATIIQN